LTKRLEGFSCRLRCRRVILANPGDVLMQSFFPGNMDEDSPVLNGKYQMDVQLCVCISHRKVFKKVTIFSETPGIPMGCIHNLLFSYQPVVPKGTMHSIQTYSGFFIDHILRVDGHGVSLTRKSVQHEN